MLRFISLVTYRATKPAPPRRLAVAPVKMIVPEEGVVYAQAQFALLTALSAVGRTYLSAGAGFVAERAGWPMFFIVSAVAAIPSMLLLWWLQTRGHFATLGPAKVVAADD